MEKLLTVLLLGICTVIHSQNNDFNLPLQNPDSVRAELVELFTELSIKHPGFYRYNKKKMFDNYIDSIFNTIQSPLNELDILRKVKPIVSKIGCLHTGIHLSNEAENKLNDLPNCLPLALYNIDGKIYVWKKFGIENIINVGDEIKKINGKEIADIYSTLLKNVPMDGYNETGKYKLLEYTFPQWYRSIIETATEFDIELVNGNSIKVKAVKFNETLNFSNIVFQPISLKIVDGIAIVKIPSFANSYLKSHHQKFKKELKSYLKIIHKEKINRLIFDLRGNTGGSDSNPAWLTSFFFDEQYKYWDRIEVTKPIAKDISGFNRVFYGKPKHENGKWLWSDKGLLSKEFKFTRIQNPSKPFFAKNIYIITDGMCLSSCSDFVAIMQSNQKAIIIGEETGGGYQGNTSGLIPTEKLKCGLNIDVPLLKYFNSVPKEKNFGRGTIPDIKMKPTLKELENDKLYLKRIIEAINNTGTNNG